MLLTSCEQQTVRSRLQMHQVKQAAPASPRPRPVYRPPDCAVARCVALTFDDGPGEYTERLLDYLAARRVRATFFLLGQNVRGNEALVRRMVADGHELGNHSWSHPDLTGLSSRGVRDQVRRTQHAIERVSGVRPKLFRPPYGATDARVGRAAGLPQILWSVDTLDWRYRSRRRNVIVGVKEPERGGIVLFHDIHATTVAAVPQVLTGLRRRGFQLVTVSDLFRGGRRLHPGWRYTHR